MRLELGTATTLPRPERRVKSLPRGDKRATVVAVAAQKGGVGKTTTSVSLASAWARNHDQRVLLVDLDPQCHVHLALRDQTHVGGGALSDVLGDRSGLMEVEEIATSTTVPDLWVTPSDPDLLNAEDRLAGRIGKELVLRRALEITRSHYDLIVLDCPPNIGSLTVNALVAADRVLVPTNASALAIAGVAGLFETVADIREHLNPALEMLGVVMTRLDGRTSRTNDAVLEMVRESYGDCLLPVSIGVANALSEAQIAGRDIFDFAPHSRAAEQYDALAACLLERLAPGA